MMTNLVKDIFAKIAQATSGIAQDGIEFVVEKGERSKLAAMYVAIGAVTGSLQVLASLVGREDGKKHSAECVNDDSLLMAALLVLHSSQSVTVASNKDAVGIYSTFSPECFYNAMEDFKKLTGRDADSVIDAALAKHARAEHDKGASNADNLLRAVCANHKPA